MEAKRRMNLKELHKRAKNHPFRTDKMGSPKSYAMILEKLGEEFLKVLKLKYNKNTTPPYPFSRDSCWMIWAHQYWSNILAVKMQYKDMSEHLVMLESYLNMIHAFIEKEKLEFFYVDFGYTKEENKDYVFNPKRIYKVVYYPDLREWDFDKKSAKLRLTIYEIWLKHSIEELEKHKKKHKDNPKEANWREYLETRVEGQKKRIQDLKTIIALEVT